MSDGTNDFGSEWIDGVGDRTEWDRVVGLSATTVTITSEDGREEGGTLLGLVDEEAGICMNYFLDDFKTVGLRDVLSLAIEGTPDGDVPNDDEQSRRPKRDRLAQLSNGTLDNSECIDVVRVDAATGTVFHDDGLEPVVILGCEPRDEGEDTLLVSMSRDVARGLYRLLAVEFAE